MTLPSSARKAACARRLSAAPGRPARALLPPAPGSAFRARGSTPAYAANPAGSGSASSTPRASAVRVSLVRDGVSKQVAQPSAGVFARGLGVRPEKGDGHVLEQSELRFELFSSVGIRTESLRRALRRAHRALGRLGPAPSGAVRREDDGRGLSKRGDRRSLLAASVVSEPSSEPISLVDEVAGSGREERPRLFRQVTHDGSVTRLAVPELESRSRRWLRVLKERATGLEPATSSLEGWRSTN